MACPSQPPRRFDTKVESQIQHSEKPADSVNPENALACAWRELIGIARRGTGSEDALTSLYANLEKGRHYIRGVLRLVVALLFIEPGLRKFFRFPLVGPPMTPLLYVQGAIEIVGV